MRSLRVESRRFIYGSGVFASRLHAGGCFCDLLLFGNQGEAVVRGFLEVLRLLEES